MNRDTFPERKFISDSMFPIDIFSAARSRNESIFDCHWHDELEFLIVTEGKALFQVDTYYYELSTGQALFINSGEIHAGYPTNDSSCSYIAVIFSPDLIFSSFYDILQIKYFQPILTKQYILPVCIKGNSDWEKRALSQLAVLVHLCTSRPYGYELSAKAHLYLILYEIISCNKFVPSNQKHPDDFHKTERLKGILKYIKENYNKKMSIKELALQANMSEGHFCRFFKQMVRKTPVDYINNFRVNKAANLLVNSRKKIIEISMDVGFDSCNYFIKIFKDYMKSTPSQYRRTNRNPG